MRCNVACAQSDAHSRRHIRIQRGREDPPDAVAASGRSLGTICWFTTTGRPTARSTASARTSSSCAPRRTRASAPRSNASSISRWRRATTSWSSTPATTRTIRSRFRCSRRPFSPGKPISCRAPDISTAARSATCPPTASLARRVIHPLVFSIAARRRVTESTNGFRGVSHVAAARPAHRLAAAVARPLRARAVSAVQGDHARLPAPRSAGHQDLSVSRAGLFEDAADRRLVEHPAAGRLSRPGPEEIAHRRVLCQNPEERVKNAVQRRNLHRLPTRRTPG